MINHKQERAIPTSCWFNILGAAHGTEFGQPSAGSRGRSFTVNETIHIIKGVEAVR